MKIKVVKSANKHASRDICPWLIQVPPEGAK
jgi:hypothetical protein